jgi:hypothetical protein
MIERECKWGGEPERDCNSGISIAANTEKVFSTSFALQKRAERGNCLQFGGS